MKKSLIPLLLAFATMAASAQTAGIDTKGTVGYVIDQRGNVAKSGFNLCWRTNYWTPAMAVADCDPDLVKKPEAPKVVVVAPPVVETAPAKKAEPLPKPAAEKVTLSTDALFDFDKAYLRAEGKASLDGLVAKIADIQLEVIIAVGHTDRIGADAYNQKLSDRRAAAVKTYLTSKGIEVNRVYTEGKGEKQPVTGDKCGKSVAKNPKLIACLQPDRRVDIEVIGTKRPK
ncbi:MAG: OmpA family protein [Rhodocyclaceae bacterium]|nr:OmpA family protein [Rhodocyclaceae bacterium]